MRGQYLLFSCMFLVLAYIWSTAGNVFMAFACLAVSGINLYTFLELENNDV